MLRTVAVVGASLAGLRAAEALRDEGFDGRLVWIGDEPHAPYDRPPLSKQVLLGAWPPERLRFRQQAGYESLALDMRLGQRAESLSLRERHVVLADGTQVPFDGLVIATGARARRLPGPPLEGRHVLRSLDDALALRQALARDPRVVVIGGGFIGLEVAAACRQLGLDVTLVEAQPAPLHGVLGATLAKRCAALHAEHGVKLRCGVGVADLEGQGRVQAVRLTDGSRIEADLVVEGIGVHPAIDWLQSSGLALGDGVLCDERLAASVPGVVAAGDVASWPHPRFGARMRVEHWTNAVEQASAAAKRLLHGSAQEAFASVPYFWSDQYDVKIQSAGRIAADDHHLVVEGSLESGRFVVIYGRQERLTGVLTWGRPAWLVRYRKLLAQGASWEQARSAAA